MHLVLCLQASGLEIGHEVMGKDGIVCGFWALGAERAVVDETRPRDYSWDLFGVIVRHPLLVAETLPLFMKGRSAWPWSLRTDLVLDSLRFWVESHTAALNLGVNVTVRIDSHFQDDYAHVCETLGVLVTTPQARSVRKRDRWPRMSWQQWMDRDPSYCRRGQALVELYGLDDLPDSVSLNSPR